mgnify:CR=1 FL=1
MKLFFLVLSVLVLCLSYLQMNSPLTEAFRSGGDGAKFLGSMDRMPSLIMSRAKMNAALQHPSFTFAIFGNSRSLMIGAKALGVPAGTYFNYSLSGQSFRNSVMMVEWLADQAKLPKIAIISIDNFSLELYGNGTIPSYSIRARSLYNDIALLNEADAPAKQQLKTVWRTLWSAWQDVKMLFSGKALHDAFMAALGFDLAAQEGGGAYRMDGSRVQATHANPELSPARSVSPVARQIIPELLVADLRKLSDLQATYKVKLVIFESPLYPSVVSGNENAVALRQ